MGGFLRHLSRLAKTFAYVRTRLERRNFWLGICSLYDGSEMSAPNSSFKADGYAAA
jgi:hypothetical protein